MLYNETRLVFVYNIVKKRGYLMEIGISAHELVTIKRIPKNSMQYNRNKDLKKKST